MTTDTQIRNLLAEGLSPNLVPLTADELEHRAGGSAIAPPRTRRLLLLAACVALVAVLAGGLVLRRAGNAGELATSPPTSAIADVASGAKVGRYFVPEALPEGFVLLGVDEGAALPSDASPARAVFTTEAGGRVSLRATAADGRWSTSDNTTEIEGGVVRWSPFRFPESDPVVMFQVDRGDVLIDGEAKGDDDADMTALFEAIDVDVQQGVPTVSDPRYTLRASQAPGTPSLVAKSATYYGPPGGYFGMAGIEVRVEQYSGPVDPDLMAGVWVNSTAVNGRTVMLGMMDQTPWWMQAPDTIVRVQIFGDLGTVTASDLLGSIVEVDDATFQAAVDQVATTADGLSPTETLTFPGGATLDLYGPKAGARGLCLTVDGERHCDLALMLRSGYTEDDQLAVAALDLLINQRWYTVGLTHDAATLDPSAEIVDGLSGPWYLMTHPDDSTTAPSTDGETIRVRPAR